MNLNDIVAEARAVIATLNRIERVLTEINTKLDLLLERVPADLGQGE